MSEVPLDKVIDAHNAVRDARAALKAKFAREDADLEAEQNQLRAYLLDQLNRSGAESIKTEKGTVYRTSRIMPSAADWSAVWQFAKDNDAMEIFQKRLKTGFITEYMEENDGALPPGVNITREFDIGVRRS